MHKVQVIYNVEVEDTVDADPKRIVAVARSLIEQTHCGEHCSIVRVISTDEPKDAN